MTEAILITAGGGIAAIAAAAGYSYFTGEDTSVSADLDNDGDDDVTASFENDEPQSAPSISLDVNDIEEITGIGPHRAEQLISEGLESPEDLYYAADSTLEGVDGFGGRAVEMIRDDIGGIDYESGNSMSEEASDGSSGNN